MAPSVTQLGLATGSFTPLVVPTSGGTIGDLLVLAYCISVANDFITGVTDDGGNTWRQEGILQNLSSVAVEVWSAKCVAPPGNVSAPDNQGLGGTGAVYDISGVDTSAARTDATVAAQAASSQHPSQNVVTTNASDVIFALFGGIVWTGAAPGATYTQLDDQAAFLTRQMFTEWKAVAAAGTIAADFTFSSAAEDVSVIAVAFKQTAVPVPATLPLAPPHRGGRGAGW